MMRIARDLLHQQIIDVNGRKVVPRERRSLSHITNEARAIRCSSTMSISASAALCAGLFLGVLPPLWIRSLQQPITPNSIRWDRANVVSRIRQRPPPAQHFVQQARASTRPTWRDSWRISVLAEREAIFETIDSEAWPSAIQVDDPSCKPTFCESLDREGRRHRGGMSPTKRPSGCPSSRSRSRGNPGTRWIGARIEVRELLEYEDDTAGGLMEHGVRRLHDNAHGRRCEGRSRPTRDLLDGLNDAPFWWSGGKAGCGRSSGAPVRAAGEPACAIWRPNFDQAPVTSAGPGDRAFD
jgi:hypothetical protein